MRPLFILLTCLAVASATAQPVNNSVALSHYVFDSFSVGRVQVKSGKLYEQSLNYNMLTGEMIFSQNGKYMAIGQPAEVDTVTIGGRKFVPVNAKFYEVLVQSAEPLMLEFTCTVEEPSASVGYGNASPTTNTTSYKTLLSNGGVYEIRLPDDFKVTPGYIYWIRKNNSYQRAGTAKQLANIYPEKKDRINQWVKNNHTSFSKRQDIIQLVQQIQQ